MAFPSNPTNNQTATVNGIAYVYNSAIGSWTRTGTIAINASFNNLVVSSSTVSVSNVTGALQVTGGAGIQGNVYAGNVYTGGLYWAANGAVISTGGGGSSPAVNTLTALKFGAF